MRLSSSYFITRKENVKDEELLFCKIIRDADKLDIYYTICNYDFQSIFWYKSFDCEKIDEQIINDFINKHHVDYSLIKSNSDQIPIFYAYVFDFNFDFSLNYLKKQKYLELFTDRIYEHFSNLVIREQVKLILKTSIEFLNKYCKYIYIALLIFNFIVLYAIFSKNTCFFHKTIIKYLYYK